MAVPNGNQKDAHHGVLREKEPPSQDKDAIKGDHSPIKDIKTSSRATPPSTSPSSSSSSTSITLSSPSSSKRMEDKENKPRSRDLPVPRVPPTVRSEDIPQFHFPLGKPQLSSEVEVLIQKAGVEFALLDGGKAYKQQMGQIAKVRVGGLILCLCVFCVWFWCFVSL